MCPPSNAVQASALVLNTTIFNRLGSTPPTFIACERRVRSASLGNDAEGDRPGLRLQSVHQILHGLDRRIARHHDRAVVDVGEAKWNEVGIAETGATLNLVGKQGRG